MKPIALALTGSLLLNVLAGSAWLMLREQESAPASVVSSTPATKSAGGSERYQTQPSAPKTVQPGSFTSTQLVDRLRALGLDDETIREFVRAHLGRERRARMRQFANANQRNAPPYWKGRVGFMSHPLTKEQREELREIEDAASAEMKRLFGSDEADLPYFFGGRNYDFLPPERASQLHRLESDYGELQRQLSEETAGFTTAADREMMRLLKEERRRDIEALLSPAELEALELRNSNSAMMLRNRLRAFDVTEQEFKNMFALQKAFDETYAPDPTSIGMSRDAEWSRRRNESERELERNLESILGSDRYAQYRTSQQHEYQSLHAAAARFNLPPSTVSNAWSAREDAVQRAQTISADRSMTSDQKKIAYGALTAETTARIESAMGRELSTAYLANNLRWLDQLTRTGSGLSVDSRGNLIVTQPRGSAPPSGPGQSAFIIQSTP